jgi:hypothetical protein
MLATAFALTVALAWSPATDTVLPLERGTRLVVENERGSVSIRSWDRDAIQITAPSGQRPDIGRTGSTLRVRPDERGGVRDVAFELTVPRWMEVRVQGRRLETRVQGTDAEVVIETLGGHVVVDGGTRVVVRTLQGAITIRNARGPVEARTVNQSVRVEDVGGDLTVETTNGSITLRGIRSGNVQAGTVNGSVTYDGSIRDDGRYAFSTHNGNISVGVPQASNVTVSAVSYAGAFQSAFPIQLTGTSRDQHYMFTLGSGSGRLDLESFNGNIELRRPAGDARP